MKALLALVALALICLHSATAFATQVPAWSSYELLQSIERSTIGHGGQRLDVLVRRSGDQRRPVLVLVPGSVCMPAFMVAGAPGTGELMTSAVLPKPATQDAMGVHLAILERRNIVSLDRFFQPQDVSPIRQLEQNPCTEAFGGSTLGHRTEDTLAQIAHIRQQPWAGDILLAGMSEGSDVVAAAAAAPENGVHALLMMSGAGMSQFFDLIQLSRNHDDRGDTAKVFSDLDAFLRDDPPDRYQGYDSARWQSFAIDATPLDNLLASRIPVFVAHGDQDTSVPIASADATVVELARKQPDRAIHYWSVKGAEHDLRVGDRRPAETIYPAFVSWALNRPRGRIYRHE